MSPHVNIGDILNILGMVQQIGNWLLVLIPIMAGAMIAYHYMMKSAAQDESAASQHTKSIRTIAISAGAGMAAMTLITWVTGWVQSTAF